jgi:hypothetical protein
MSQAIKESILWYRGAFSNILFPKAELSSERISVVLLSKK